MENNVFNEWKYESLGNYIKVRGGKAFKSKDFKEQGVPILRISNIKNNGIDLKNCVYADPAKLQNYSNFLLENGNIVIAMSGATTGKTGTIQEKNLPLLLNQRVGVFEIQDNTIINQRFLKYVIASTYFQKILEIDAIGGAQPNISPSQIESIHIYIPPINEQQKIACILSSVDEAIEKTEGIVKQIKIVKRGITHELFSRGIGNTEYKDSDVGRIPKSWKVVDMDTVFDTIDGDRGKNYPNTNDFIDEGYCLFLDTKNVTKSGFLFDTKKFISKEKDKVLRNGKLSRNDFVMTSRGSIGNIAFYSENVPYENIRINSAMLILRPYDKDLNFDFWMHLLRGRVIEKYIRKFKVGSAQPHVTKKSFQQLKVSIPSSSKEQQKISNILNEFDNKIRNEEENLLYLDSLKRGLMQQLLTGKVRVPTTESEEVPQ